MEGTVYFYVIDVNYASHTSYQNATHAQLVSGVGNWVADEICFQARVDPAKRCSALRDDEVGAMAFVMTYVCGVR